MSIQKSDWPNTLKAELLWARLSFGLLKLLFINQIMCMLKKWYFLDILDMFLIIVLTILYNNLKFVQFFLQILSPIGNFFIFIDLFETTFGQILSFNFLDMATQALIAFLLQICIYANAQLPSILSIINDKTFTHFGNKV